MKTLIAASMLLVSSGFAVAADMTAPVREVVEATAANWTEEAFGNEKEVFSEDRLDRVFSVDFAALYREASKNPAYDLPEGETTGFPFDYDPIARGQDGCPFQNIRVEDDGDGQVTALFNNRACMGDDPAYKQDTVLIFHVQEENGRAVIDDIYPVENGQSGQSIKDELKTIAGQ
jgi:hypothetical protein